MKLHHTRGIVLRPVKYGETSLIVSVFTELFGLQSYIINGVRKQTRKGAGTANYFQPGAILDMVVYFNEHRNLNRVKEFRWGFLYQNLYANVLKNSITLYMVELLVKCLKQPDPNPDLYYFLEESFQSLDAAAEKQVANFPPWFALKLAYYFGVPPTAPSAGIVNDSLVFDLAAGEFSSFKPGHSNYVSGNLARVIAALMKYERVEDLGNLKLNREQRQEILQALEIYYILHFQEFGKLKTLPVLETVWGS